MPNCARCPRQIRALTSDGVCVRAALIKQLVRICSAALDAAPGLVPPQRHVDPDGSLLHSETPARQVAERLASHADIMPSAGQT